jgi:GntR family transcriptional regulator, arabinose operon transcriptional repressor
MLRKATAVREYLLGELTAGRLKPGIALPPEVKLAEDLGVSRQTLRRALAVMDDEGIIRREQGRGTFVNEDAHRRLQQDVSSYALIVARLLPATFPLLGGFQKACQSAQGHAVLYDNGNNIETQASIILGMLYGGLQMSGVAMLPPTTPLTPSYHVTALQERGIPVVLCHRGVVGAQAPTLAIAYEEMGRLAGGAVAKRGHRLAGLFCSYRSLGLDLQIRGFRETLAANGGAVPDSFVYEGRDVSLEPTIREKEVVEAVQRMVGSDHPPTAIWVASGQDAELVYSVLRRLGLRVPEDISLVSTIVEPDSHQSFLRTVSAVVVPDADIGRRAFEVLNEIQSGERPLRDDEKIVMPVHWNEGQTLGPKP